MCAASDRGSFTRAACLTDVFNSFGVIPAHNKMASANIPA